jgi:prepilin-type N-terminal cleavage/methylation domain-containing protein
MTTTTLSRAPKSISHRRQGFTLAEVLIASTLSSIILLGVLTTFLFVGRSAANLRNYTDMEAQARKALAVFAQDTRQASAVAWASANSVAMIVNGAAITYDFSSGRFTRTRNGVKVTLLNGITQFNFLAYSITGTAIPDISSTAGRASANSRTKEIQISLSAARTAQTLTTATNIVLSARYVLRNKTVTA